MTVLDSPTETLHAGGQTIALFEAVHRLAPERNKEYERLVEKFGFKGMAASLQTQQRISSCGFTALTGYELGITTLFVPTTYVQQQWKNYRFDTIPLPVLKTLEAVQSSKVFHTYEIWTPEVAPVAQIDPILVGVISDAMQRGRDNWMGGNSQAWNWQDRYGPNSMTQFFPIARWGESLVSFSEMEAQVLRKHKRLRRVCPSCNVRLYRADRFSKVCLQCGHVHVAGATSAW